MPATSPTPTTPTLDIRLLGNFCLATSNDHVVGLTSLRAQALLAYLLLHRDAPQSRQHLAFLFWPDSGEAQARNNLRQILHALRHVLPNAEAFLLADAMTLRWQPDAPYRLDTAEFERALALAECAQSQGDIASERAALTQAVDLYGGDLLPSCYDEWIAPEREELRQRFFRALERLVHLCEAGREYARAAEYARRHLASDPLSEEACRTLMRVLTLAGDRPGALQAYRACAQALERELDIPPSPETTEAYERARSLPPARGSSHREGTQRSPGTGPTHPPPHQRHPQTAAAAPTLIGRAPAYERLHAAWQRTSAGAPGFVLVTGEAGIGKSRLVEELGAAVQAQGASVAKTRCYAAEGRLSLAPVTDWLRGEAIWPTLARLDRLWLSEVSRILPDLVREHPDLPPYEPISEYGQRRRFFEALARAVLAAPQPTLLTIDDLHWCDQETLEWLHYLLRFDSSARILVVGTARAEELPPQHPTRTLLLDLHSTTSVLELPLHPLDAAETAKVAASLVHRALDDASALRLYRETEGNPLFIVETIRAGLTETLPHPEPSPEKAQAPHVGEGGDAADLPPRVRAVLTARLAQLSPPAREVAALAAAIGREFRLDVLADASGKTEDEVVRLLDELWQRRIMREQGANTYDFTHDKLREVAYAETSIPQRRLLHRRIASALEATAAADLDPVSGQVAAQYDLAGLPERAIPFYTRASEVAQRVYANEDAIRFLVRALALLEALPATVTRDQEELRLLIRLTPVYRVVRGWTAPELERAVDRALVLCERVGDPAQRAETLYAWGSLLVVQARFEQVLQVKEDLWALREHVPSAVLALSSIMAAGARMHQGAVVEAHEQFDALISSIDPTQSGERQRAHDWNAAVHVRAWDAHALWCLGYPEQALRLGQEAVQAARTLVLPFNQALAATYLTLTLQFSADSAILKAGAEEALALTIEYKAPYYRIWATILVGYASAWEQPDAARCARLSEAIEAFRATGAQLRLPYYFWLLASVCRKARRFEDALTALDEAHTISNANGEHWWDAEISRLRGEVLMRLGAPVDEVEAELRQAADTARSQQARSLELRAAMSRARWERRLGSETSALDTLRAVYATFTEGFETPDLRAARHLLDDHA